MESNPYLSSVRTFQLGPNNQRLDNPADTGEPSGYCLLYDASLPLPQLLERHGVVPADGENRITAEHFPSRAEAVEVRKFELFSFAACLPYGRSGVDEPLVRDRLARFRFRPATLAELVCFAGHLRDVHQGRGFEAMRIVALGSTLGTTQLVREAGWLRKAVFTHYRYHPELQCVAGRPKDIMALSRTGSDGNGHWPAPTLFLAASLN